MFPSRKHWMKTKETGKGEHATWGGDAGSNKFEKLGTFPDTCSSSRTI